jgi:hypothetical protein
MCLMPILCPSQLIFEGPIETQDEALQLVVRQDVVWFLNSPPETVLPAASSRFCGEMASGGYWRATKTLAMSFIATLLWCLCGAQLADMGRPFEKPLLVDLVVDARIADNWFDAK